MNRLPISVCMISGAEAGRVGRALESIASWTSELVVVLNDDVHDETEAIATKHGAKVFREPWKGHIAQKNSAAAKASQEWILGLDADEVVSPELRGEIEQLFGQPALLESYVAINFPRLSWFCGRWIRHGDWYPDRQTRLWRRGRAQWGGIDPHDKLLVDGAIKRLRSDLYHFTGDSIDHQLSKTLRYTDDFVRHCAATGRQAGGLDLLARPAWRFLRAYFLRLGFLDGWPGYYLAWQNAFATAARYAKVHEARLRKDEPA
jgi:glycosyltransferase involved in cell wall biosynthesis